MGEETDHAVGSNRPDSHRLRSRSIHTAGGPRLRARRICRTRLEPQTRRHRSRRTVPADLPHINEAKRQLQQHRNLQHLCPEPCRRRTRGHPGSQFTIQGRRLHIVHRCPRQHQDYPSIGIPIYWLGGNKVADNYTDFYDGTWDDEANDKNQLGNDAHDTSQTTNQPWTGCDHDGTEYVAAGLSVALGKNAVQTGQPNSPIGTRGPLRGTGSSLSSSTRPFYALSPVFQVPSMNASRLSPTGAPHPGKITSNSDTGIEHRVKLLKNGQYRIDVKGSERSQPGGTIDNPRVKIFAGSSKLSLLNGSSNGVSQTSSETRATGGGAGENSRLDIKAKETDNYALLIHRAAGDNGTYTVTVTNLSWPDGRRAPDITVDQENRNNVQISWTKSKKTQSSLKAPGGNYKIEYRTLSGGSWSNAGTVDESARDATITGLSRNTAYEIRVRMIPPADSTHIYRWGYARVYTTN